MPELSANPEEASAPQPAPSIDLEELAKLIFELLKRELMLENERTGR